MEYLNFYYRALRASTHLPCLLLSDLVVINCLRLYPDTPSRVEIKVSKAQEGLDLLNGLRKDILVFLNSYLEALIYKYMEIYSFSTYKDLDHSIKSFEVRFFLFYGVYFILVDKVFLNREQITQDILINT
ncbi:LOW QUALITY PROTEIN: hypothetical protein TEQG_08740 [Trichophyton equinum CBS 127.97]|uniref:Uncharacterized protein n=1 Tax=Trichophyton equinum (strain ATCC MYA-4606 / CBS 127.97) TaxID=559882 RepID=F2PYQ4_TRIEC|nr:LOW QUALITY PROTEIN: hypothetical protein TEQG_08740 [Trichophyton equinum CBS 127.97]